jgi:hypothetical protein
MGSRSPITRVYIPYWEWEDWINGMWGKSENEDNDLKCAIEFTGDHEKYGNAMRKVIDAWPKTMLNSLTNTGINRRAFLGRCAVTFTTGIPEYITRIAWKELTDEQRELADAQAQKYINEYEKKYRSIYSNLGEQVL